MLDIALIREKPDWVKEQIGKLYDETALSRIDTILELDAKRRELRTKTETAQASRNQLNRAMGKLRGNKTMDNAEKTARALAACAALRQDDPATAAAFMDGSASVDPSDNFDFKAAFDELIAELKSLGNRIEDGFATAKLIENELEANMFWIPNLPHSSVPVFESEDSNIPYQLQGCINRIRF